MAYEINEVREKVLELRSLARDGQGLRAKIVLARLIEPFLELMDRMQNNAVRWLTLSEAMRRAERNRNFFEKPLVSLGGRCRLEVWREAGHAEKADGSIWLIHPALVDEARRESGEGDEGPRDTTHGSELSDEAIAARFLKQTEQGAE